MHLEVTRTDIDAAAKRVRGHIRRTPLLDLGTSLSPQFNLSVKLDFTQPTGSFKVRGAFSLLTRLDEHEHVAAASGGNFGIAVAYACSELGHHATVFVPDNSPSAKIDRIEELGADVRRIPGFYDEAWDECDAFVAETGAFMAHAYDQPEVVAGQGTAAKEIFEQDPATDSLVVAVGGGGLIAGIASWARDDARVVSAEPYECASFHAACENGGPIAVEVGGVASSSLGAVKIGDYCWAAREWVDQAVLVEDDAIVEAQNWLWSHARLAVEPSAATTIAALMQGAYKPEPGERVVAMLSGANFDPATL